MLPSASIISGLSELNIALVRPCMHACCYCSALPVPVWQKSCHSSYWGVHHHCSNCLSGLTKLIQPPLPGVLSNGELLQHLIQRRNLLRLPRLAGLPVCRSCPNQLAACSLSDGSSLRSKHLHLRFVHFKNVVCQVCSCPWLPSAQRLAQQKGRKCLAVYSPLFQQSTSCTKPCLSPGRPRTTTPAPASLCNHDS